MIFSRCQTAILSIKPHYLTVITTKIHTTFNLSTIFGSSPFYLHQKDKKDRFKNRKTDLSKMEKSDPSKRRRDGTILAEPVFKSPKFQEISDFGKKAADSAYLAILSNGAPGFGKSFYLFTTNSCYLFNCPEMTDRFIDIGHEVKLNRFDNILFTQSNWENCGGLPGFVQTLHTSGVSKITLHGAPYIQQIIETTKPYVDERIEMILKESNFEKKYFEDETAKIEYIPLFTQEYAKLRNTQKEAKERGDDQLLHTLQTVTQLGKKISIAFLVQLKVRGYKLDGKKLQALKVKPGPWIKELVEGKAVTLHDGRLINPEDVRVENKVPGKFLVVDCPSHEFLKSTIENERFKELKQSYFSESKSEQGPYLEVVIHLTSIEVYDSPEYQEFIKSFGPKTRHMALNERCPYVDHAEGIFRMQTMLNSVHPQIFPKLKFLRLQNLQFDNSPGSLNLCEPFLRYKLQPNDGFKDFESRIMNEQAVLDSVNETPGFKEMLAQYHAKLGYQASLKVPSRVYPEIIFLGTSSSTPTKYRNVSGILLNLNHESSIILDCGEGTYQQMFHLLGQDETERILTNLKSIFLSHMHMDHHLGIITLFKKRREAFRRRNMDFDILRCLAPAPLFGMYELYSSTVENLSAEYCYTKTKPKEAKEYETWYWNLKQLAEHIGLKKILPVKVNHPMLACGLVMETHCGKKLVYSGDTVPHQGLIDEGMGADILIHEATFGDAMHDMAVFKKHSTVGQAIEVGKQMKAKYTILTHFSARYSKYPILPENLDKNVIVAMDNMVLNYNRLDMANAMIPVLQCLFQNELEDAAKKEYFRGVRLDRRNKLKDKKVDQLQQVLQA